MSHKEFFHTRIKNSVKINESNDDEHEYKYKVKIKFSS